MHVPFSIGDRISRFTNVHTFSAFRNAEMEFTSGERTDKFEVCVLVGKNCSLISTTLPSQYIRVSDVIRAKPRAKTRATDALIRGRENEGSEFENVMNLIL